MLVEIKKMNKDEVTVCTSLDVAETFEKEHRNVLADIRSIQCDISTAEFSALFYETTYKASNGKSNPMYYMTRDGFTLLVMGYTGDEDAPTYFPARMHAVRKARHAGFKNISESDAEAAMKKSNNTKK